MTMNTIVAVNILPSVMSFVGISHDLYSVEVSFKDVGKATKRRSDFEDFWKKEMVNWYEPVLEEIVAHIPGYRDINEIEKELTEFCGEMPKKAAESGGPFDAWLKSFNEFSRIAQESPEICPELVSAFKRLLQNKAELLRVINGTISKDAIDSNLPYSFFRTLSMSFRTELAILEKESTLKEDSLLYRDRLGELLAHLNMLRESILLYLLLCSVNRLDWDELSKLQEFDVEALDMEYFNEKLSELESATKKTLEEAVRTGYYVKPEFRPKESFIQAFSSALVSEE